MTGRKCPLCQAPLPSGGLPMASLAKHFPTCTATKLRDRLPARLKERSLWKRTR
jgi:hypothetical protein